MELYDRLKKTESFSPNSYLLNTTFEAALRLKNSDRITELLENYVELGKEPSRILLNKISNVKDLPDRIYVLLRENFKRTGLMKSAVREFSQP
jgi:hypothetical protein